MLQGAPQGVIGPTLLQAEVATAVCSRGVAEVATVSTLSLAVPTAD